DNQGLEAARKEEARQPECIVSNLIAERDRRWRLAGRLGTAIARDQKLCQQACGISALDPIKARLRPIWELDGQQPAALAELEGAMECRLGRYSRFSHLGSPDVNVFGRRRAMEMRRPASRLIASRGSRRQRAYDER